MSPQNWSDKMASIRARIAGAARRAGRNPDSITIVAVSKGQPTEAMDAVRALGLRDFAENYLQEAAVKMDALGRAGLTWHFTGQLQSNKTRAVAERFDWVHGLDRPQIARRLNAQRPFHAPPLNVCLQVKLAEEAAKGGVAPKDLPALAAQVATLERLKLRGLMCLPPEESDEEKQRHWFAELRRLFESLNASGAGLDTLSMGMSADFEAAVLEGATLVRIGTAIFGERRRASVSTIARDES